jgi:flagellar basal body-associated protein FliL
MPWGMKYGLYILLVAVLWLGGAPNPPAFAESAPEEGEAAPEAPKPAMIALNPLPIPILKDDRVAKYIVVTMGMEAPPEADAGAIAHEAPRINDALLREAYLFAKENDGAEDVDMEALRARLLPLVQSILGDKKINGLYFTRVNSI